MTTGDLPAPPEGKLIRTARERAIPKLSIRAAAAALGISPEHWGNIERGYKSVSAGKAPLRTEAPAELLAKMGRLLGIEPARMEAEGQRPDAAAVMRSTAPIPAAVNSAIAAGIDPDDPHDPWIRPVREQVEAAERIGGGYATGSQVFFGSPASSTEASIWDDRTFSRESKILAIATLRAWRARDEAGRQNYGRSGRAGLALVTLAGR